MNRGGLIARGIRWRLGGSLLVVLAATLAVATATLGPLYLHTAGDSVVRRTVQTAPVQETGLTLGDYSAPGSGQATVLAGVNRAIALSGRRDIFDAPLYTETAQTGATGTAQTPYAFNVIARTGICGVLHFVAGRCDLGPGDAVITARSARRLGVRLGELVHIDPGPALRVTGVVAVPDLGAAYWWGDGVADFPFLVYQPHGPIQLDPLFASPATAQSVGGSTTVFTAQLPLRTARVDLANEDALKRAETRVDNGMRALGLRPVSSLQSVFADADQQRHQMTTIVAVGAIQLVLLAVWVLGSLLARSAEARHAEARAARLRGFSPVSLVWVTAAEPGLLCAIGSVLGVAIAWATIHVARAALLEQHSSIAFDGWTIVAIALTVVAIAAALALGTVRLLRATELRRARSARVAARAPIVVDSVLLVLAVAALLALGTTGALSGHADPLATIAPGLIALGVAVLAVRGVLFACRLGITLSRDSAHVAPFLALRQTVRRPGVLRQARVLIIALCLACFAIAAWSIARTNRATAANFQVGAHTVVTVTPTTPTTLLTDTHHADPYGHYAMAVIDFNTPTTVELAVDSARLAAVAAWPRGISPYSAAQVARAIGPPTAAPVTLPDAVVHVRADVRASGQALARLGDLQLDLWVFNGTGGTNIIELGALRTGTHLYGGSLTLTCPGGCRLTGIGIAPTPGASAPAGGSVSLAVTGLSGPGGGPLAGDLVAGGWRSSTAGVGVDAPTPGRLRLTIPATAIVADSAADPSVTPPMASVADVPLVLPGVATDELQAATNGSAAHPIATEGLDSQTLALVALKTDPTSTASALPQVGANGLLLDLGLLSRAQVDPTSIFLVDQVWLGPRAPANALARLRATGLRPVSVAQASAVYVQSQHSGPALADDFLLACAVAALLVAAASTLGALGAATRERATELTSLQVAGVSTTTLSRALTLETAILLITAVCGAGAGILAAVLALPSLPEGSAASLAPLRFTLPVGAIAIITAAVIVAVALAASAITAILLARMTPTLLRSAPDDIAI